jgi:plastocyanin
VTLRRRRLLEAGGGILAALLIRPVQAAAADIIDIAMRGTKDGSHVWFDPIGLRVQPGQTVRWTNRDPGNSHTVTAYHPSIHQRPRRIPEAAEPWDSDYLLPDESFEVTFRMEGVYDYYCVPHEHAGMVGRIVVGVPVEGERPEEAAGEELVALPEAARGRFPSVERILAEARVAGG